MKKAIIMIIVLFTSSSCKGKLESEREFSSKYKLKVLDEILRFYDDYALINIKKIAITRYPNLPSMSPYYYYDTISNKFNKENSFPKLISRLLEVEDTIFINKQIESNKEFDLGKLSDYGYKIIDNKNITANNNFLIISKPILNKDNTKLFLRISRGGIEGSSYVFYKENNKWNSLKEIENWIE